MNQLKIRNDLTDKKFTRLLVLYRIKDKIYSSGRKAPLWVCLCDCGKQVYLPSRALVSGNTKSCGCIRSELVFKNKRVMYNGSVITYNGLDRLDNSKLHYYNNVVACCKYCNYGKRERSLNEFMSWIDRIKNKWIQV